MSYKDDKLSRAVSCVCYRTQLMVTPLHIGQAGWINAEDESTLRFPLTHQNSVRGPDRP